MSSTVMLNVSSRKMKEVSLQQIFIFISQISLRFITGDQYVSDSAGQLPLPLYLDDIHDSRVKNNGQIHKNLTDGSEAAEATLQM